MPSPSAWGVVTRAGVTHDAKGPARRRWEVPSTRGVRTPGAAWGEYSEGSPISLVSQSLPGPRTSKMETLDPFLQAGSGTARDRGNPLRGSTCGLGAVGALHDNGAQGGLGPRVPSRTGVGDPSRGGWGRGWSPRRAQGPESPQGPGPPRLSELLRHAPADTHHRYVVL